MSHPIRYNIHGTVSMPTPAARSGTNRTAAGTSANVTRYASPALLRRSASQAPAATTGAIGPNTAAGLTIM
jgi:hypothetical protein